MSRFAGRMPDGTVTEDQLVYALAWRELGDQVAAVLDVDVRGYDPGVLVAPKGDGSSGAGAMIPVWLVNRILARANQGGA